MGRNRRYYHITTKGEELLKYYRDEWHQYSAKITGMFEGGNDYE